MDDIKSLSHSKYRCKYHIVFAPKYRRQIIYKKDKSGRRKNTKRAERKKRSKDHRGGMLPGSYPYASGNTAALKCSKFHGIPERKKQPDDLRKISGVEIQVPE